MRSAAIIEQDWRDPAAVLAAFADEPWALALLSGGGEETARWSYLARRPAATLAPGARNPADPFDALRALLGPPARGLEDGPPFQGGVAGLCSYELGLRAEGLDLGRHADWPDLACAVYPALLAFDHRERCVLAIGRGDDDETARARALAAAHWLSEPPALPALPRGRIGAAQSDDGDAYEAAAADVVERIARGEIFQANIARLWRGALDPGAHPYHLFARLAWSSPAPFASYLRGPGFAVVSNSPERFVRVSPTTGALIAETRPIKGTRPRGREAAEDERLAAALVASDKDRAENLMIVDLMRNDLARVCRPGSVAAPSLLRLESFANVHHLVSTVRGELAVGQDGIDLLRSCLPPGSITGAPKIQAMKVIAGHEPSRGPFFGAMVWLGFDGALDSSVLIRTVGLTESGGGWRLEARAGAGIVADSQPASERRETEVKIAAILAALASA